MPDEKEGAKPAGGWLDGLARFDARWTRVESRLCGAVLVSEIAALAIWVSLKGLSNDYVPNGSAGGLMFRIAVTAVLFGVVARLATRPRRGMEGEARSARERLSAIVVAIAIVAGGFAGRLWVHAGVTYAGNWLNWLQNASVLMLIGGLRGLVTRLTLWVALLGGSLATGRGKHIHVDVLLRYLPLRARMPVVVVGWIAAAAMCFVAIVGFCDHIAIAQYRARAFEPCPGDAEKSCDTSAGDKLGVVEHEIGTDLFLLGRQASLDLKTLPKVVAGTPFDKYLTAGEWNAWMKDADWEGHFRKEAVEAQLVDASNPEAKKTPAVNVPGGQETARGLLIRELNFVFPFGLLMIGLRFVLRAILVVGGRIKYDPDEAHEEEGVSHGEPAPDAGAKEGA